MATMAARLNANFRDIKLPPKKSNVSSRCFVSRTKPLTSRTLDLFQMAGRRELMQHECQNGVFSRPRPNLAGLSRITTVYCGHYTGDHVTQAIRHQADQSSIVRYPKKWPRRGGPILKLA